MKKFGKPFSIAILLAVMQIAFVHNPCSAQASIAGVSPANAGTGTQGAESQGSGNFSFELLQSFGFSKSTATIENLDHCNFEGTQATTGWTATKEFTTYTLIPELIWLDSCTNIYVEVAARYGWVLGGKSISYPQRWDINGYRTGYKIEVGYIMNVYKRFNFIPFIGFTSNSLHTKIKHHKFTHKNPSSFISQNGNTSHTTLYFPYIGIELDFTKKFCNNNDIQISVEYNFGYGGGNGYDKVPHCFITDDPSTSRYGSRTKYRDIVSHDFEIAFSHSFAKKWTVALELDYGISYNTHKLPVKFQHNRAIVEAGQFTPSQYHVVSDYVAHAYAVLVAVVYNFSGESGAFITR